MRPLEPPTLAEIVAARDRIRGAAMRTPLVRLNGDADANIYLKLENLQPIGSFKLRGAGNALRKMEPAALRRGVYTASAGNMAQGVAWCARELGVPCHVVVPDRAPQTKLAAIERLGAHIIKVTFDQWWQVIVTHRYPGLDGVFVHPVCNTDVMAGHGTIGLEILEDLPEPDAILVPFGGGGLSCGIAAAVRAKRPGTRIFACEVETAAPLSASLAQGRPVEIDRVPTFIDGIGGKSVLAEMWPLVRDLLAGSLVTSVERVVAAVRLLVDRNHVVAEGAGAAPVAVAMAGEGGHGTVVCVVSGGNIDPATLATILRGDVPS
ncbi:MAG TPA: threonine/serine dehydratase [Gemmatimonadales bacterium]